MEMFLAPDGLEMSQNVMGPDESTTSIGLTNDLAVEQLSK
jgi:hypothetical protein